MYDNACRFPVTPPWSLIFLRPALFVIYLDIRGPVMKLQVLVPIRKTVPGKFCKDMF